MRWIDRAWMCAMACGAAMCAAQEQYPKPLIHTPTDHPAARVLLLDVEGMHALDLALWVGGHPESALAELAARGDTFTNAQMPWANPAAGLVSLVTGGTPISTGILGSDVYDRRLWAAGSRCVSGNAGARIDLAGGMDEATLPLDPTTGCGAVRPHTLVRVNNIFEVVKSAGGRTAWAAQSAALADLLQGPSGKGLDEACGFLGVDDEQRVSAVLHWIDGKDCRGLRNKGVPEMFGMSFASVGSAQSAEGYLDGIGAPSAGLAKAFARADAAIGRMIAELKRQQLYESTWIVVTSAYGQSPMDPRRRRIVPLKQLTAVAQTVRGVVLAHASGGGVGMVWLRDPSTTAAVAKAYGDRASSLGIQEIYSGERIGLTLNPPSQDSRTPDIILQPVLGVSWGESPGGMGEEATHVPMLVSGAQFTGRVDKTPVPASQLAPLILRALGMEKFGLDALHKEHSPALPGIF